MADRLPWPLPLFACIVLGLILYWLIARRLRRTLPDVWHGLGQPSGMPVAGSVRQFGAQAQLTWFLLTKKIIPQGDGTLSGLVWAYRLVVLLFVLLVIFGPR